MPTLASACQQLRVAACDGVYCLIVWPHFPHLMTRALVLKRKEALADCEVMFCCHLICQCLLLHGWVTLVGGYAAFLYQTVWIFLYMCALAGNSDMGASARDAACRWTPLQCCLIDGANVKCDFCLSWWVNNWILIPESNLNMALAIASSAASSIRVMDAVSLWVYCDGDSTFLHVIMLL